MTRYVILGAGAIGGAIGGRLAHAGKEVVWVARGEHGRALADHGLTLRTPDQTVQVTAPVWTIPEQATLTTDDTLIAAVKTQHVADLLAVWADVPVSTPQGVRPAGQVLPICLATNGVAAEEIAQRYFQRVFGITLWMPVAQLNPGEVIVRFTPVSGVLFTSRVPAALTDEADRALLKRLERDFEAAKLDVDVVDDVMPWKYSKLLANLGNAIEALVGPGNGGDLPAQAVAEGAEILAAAEIATAPSNLADLVAARGAGVEPVPGAPAELGGSTWQSMVKAGGSVETDFLNGEIAAIAHRIGRGAPMNATLASLARVAARAGHRPGDLSHDDLVALLGSPTLPPEGLSPKRGTDRSGSPG